MDSFFEHVLYLADNNLQENVLLYAVKRAASFGVSAGEMPHLVRWMLYSCRRSATCLNFVVEYLSSVEKIFSVKPPLDEISKFLHTHIPVAAQASHTFEVAWMLFLARELNIILDAKSLIDVYNMRSSVWAIITLDLRQPKLIKGFVRTNFWKSFANTDELKSDMWLLAYEATKKEWWKKKISKKYIKDHPFFGDIIKAGVEFYDPKIKAKVVTRSSLEMLVTRMSETADANDLAGYPF